MSKRHNFLLVGALGLVPALAFVGPAAAQLGVPELGAANKWVCSTTGSQAKSYVTTVIGNTGGLLYLEDQTDREFGRVEMPAQLYGLNLYNRRVLPEDTPGRGRERVQEFDLEDFADYALMQPGTTISADVGESDGRESWTWRYSIEIGQPEIVVNDVLGEVQVLPVSEERWIYRQNIGSSYDFKIIPETAQIVSWRYSGDGGSQECDLYLSYKKKIKNPIEPPAPEPEPVAAEETEGEAAATE